MSTPLSTPIRQAKLGIASTKSLPLATEYKKLLNEQYQRLWTKHQQDLDLIDDIRGYVKARLSIEREYASSLGKLGKQHSSHIAKKFALLNQCDLAAGTASANVPELRPEQQLLHESEASDSRLQKRLAKNGLDEPDTPCSLYKVWSEHINRLQSTSKNRADQFEQLIMVVDKLKDIRSHKASIGKKCLDTHLKRIHEDVLVTMVELEKARKLYYEDESQAKKARENEEKIKKKRSGLLTKFTDLQAKKEKTSAQREANDIQSTQARNDYIMALAAATAHLQHYYQRDLKDFIQTVDDGVLDHCKVFMATLSECDINSLKDSLTNAQYWSKMINLTGSQRTNSIFLDCEQSLCLRDRSNLTFEPCNNDPIRTISLEYNADYALQHEIDKWFTWFKKECRNLSQLKHQLEVCQRAFAEGKKSIELNGQQTEDLEPKIIELKQQIRKSEAAKLKAQARLKVIKEGGMQIEEWSAVESEIQADMARAQSELEAKRAKELVQSEDSSDGGPRNVGGDLDGQGKQQASSYIFESQTGEQVKLEISKDSDDSDDGSIHNLASVSRSTSNIIQKQQNALSGYSALTDPSLVWQDDYSSTWGNAAQGSNYNVVVTDAFCADNTDENTKNIDGPVVNDGSSQKNNASISNEDSEQYRYGLLEASKLQSARQNPASMTVQSSSPLSAIVDGVQTSSSPYQGMMAEAYKSDYECDYNRNLMRSTGSSTETYNQQKQLHQQQQQPGSCLNEPIVASGFGRGQNTFIEANEFEQNSADFNQIQDGGSEMVAEGSMAEEIPEEVNNMLNRRVVALYPFDKTNEDDLSFNENDILLVIEINDANWMKARNEETGDEGYIPTSYVTLHNDEEILESADITTIKEPDASNKQQQDEQDTQVEQPNCYFSCRAIYDYEPDADTYEDDGLPHLALVQGELMRIINQGEDDGWWLVEKEETGVRGHVPSMLVEELDGAEEAISDEEEKEKDQNVEVECSEHNDLKSSIGTMPSFEPPVLQPYSKTNMTDEAGGNNNDINNNESIEGSQKEGQTTTNQSLTSSLLPTSFIIIEPTPEVESRSVEESLKANRDDEISDEKAEDRDLVQGTTRITTEPPNDSSYSVVNEDFVLEGPSRKPFQHRNDEEQVQPQRETPTNSIEEAAENISNEVLSKTLDENYEPLSEVESLDMPAPPAVVIEVCEDKKRLDYLESDEEQDEVAGNDDCSSNDCEARDDQSVSSYAQREIKPTRNVDVNPILRLRAEEFSKQIIAEALMLAPGADVGPSTSSANDVSY